MPSRPPTRRQFLRLSLEASAAAAALTLLPPSIRRALAIPAAVNGGTIEDVGHVVILMQENRSFDHYFGTLRGVRGFGDRHPIPLGSGEPVWQQSDGTRVVPPYHLDTKTTSAWRIASAPHSFSDAQAAWNQGKFGFWPQFKTPQSMGHYRRADLPFQFALADAFTICDAYHCSVTTGTDPNRIFFWSGSNFDPGHRARGENCTDADSEPDNLRCWVRGALPEPGYNYVGSAFKWPTIPDVLETAGISWRIYQDPNDNWTGAMHGGLAFESFRSAQPGSGLYEKGMRHWSLERLAQDVREGTLPQVTWVLPSPLWSEHPSPSSPLQGAEFTARVLDALTANPKVWGRTVFFLTFDENDGQFDHVPPPAPPSYNVDGIIAGGSTLDLRGEYFSDPERKYLDPADTTSGTVRPWGLGPRVPMLAISPWSKGGWVNSQVFDHSSVGQFLEKRFALEIPAISPWHRAVCGDLTSAFDFKHPNGLGLPRLPKTRGSSAVITKIIHLPTSAPPATPERLFQEPGVRPSRALGYELHATAVRDSSVPGVNLTFRNTGRLGAVFHVYDKLHLDRIPRRYTVEASKELTDQWGLDEERYDLWVLGANGFLREFQGSRAGGAEPQARLRYDTPRGFIELEVTSPEALSLLIIANAHRVDGPWKLAIVPNIPTTRRWLLKSSGYWYDFTASNGTWAHRFAGRLETGTHSVSDVSLASVAVAAACQHSGEGGERDFRIPSAAPDA
jgi:phospholipase C